MRLTNNILYTLIAMVLAFPFNLNGQNLYFPHVGSGEWETISPETFGWCTQKIDSLYGFLEQENTKAFILLKDGRIVLEKYFDDHDQNKAWYWASAGKTITSFLTGKAQEEGLLDIGYPSSQYLGISWTTCSPEDEAKITVRHQLTMTTGLDDSVDDSFCTLDTCLVCLTQPGTRWSYHNAPYTLLDGVIASATGKTLNNYASQKLLIPTGMSGLFFQLGYNNVFFSTARSMARFGLLIQNRGKWADKVVMADTTYFREMTNTSQSLNKSYGYLWWLNGKESFMIPQSQFVFNGSLFPNAPADMISALGANGQFLNVSPKTGWVMVRMGETPDSSAVSFLMNDEIWSLINQLPCDVSSVDPSDERSNRCAIYPNPASDELFFKAPYPVSQVEILDIHGRPIIAFSPASKEGRVTLHDLPAGLYIIRIRNIYGAEEIHKLKLTR